MFGLVINIIMLRVRSSCNMMVISVTSVVLFCFLSHYLSACFFFSHSVCKLAPLAHLKWSPHIISPHWVIINSDITDWICVCLKALSVSVTLYICTGSLLCCLWKCFSRLCCCVNIEQHPSSWHLKQRKAVLLLQQKEKTTKQ